MQKVAVQRSVLVLAFLVVGLVAVFVTSAATAQARPQEEILYRIVSVDANSWVVTAEDQQTGTQVRFKLNPRAFVNKKFRADLQGKGQGHRFSVTAPRNEPLANCCAMSGGPPGETPSRRPSTRRPSAQGRRGAPPTSRPGGPSAGPGAPGGGTDFEIVEVDPKTWTVTASGVGTGQTVRFRVDPSTFVGYEFRASLRDLHRGQGFGMIGLNSSPLSGCCTLVGASP
jgi:hypothetical protein